MPSINVDKTIVRLAWEQTSLEHEERIITVVSTSVVVKSGGVDVIFTNGGIELR